MNYGVKRLADLAGVSARTLHFYDQIGLLSPAGKGANGYRYYDDAALLRLQQILFFRELDFSLSDIRQIMAGANFDLAGALGAHRGLLEERRARLDRLIHTIDRTISHLQGELKMSEKEFYDGFSGEKQKEYSAEARRRYGNDIVVESERRWNSLTEGQKAARLAEGDALTLDIVNHMGEGPDSPTVQRLIGLMHEGIGFYYDCTYEIFQGLGQMYYQDPRFRTMYETKFHPDLPQFLEKAITYYCEARTANDK